MGLKGLWSSSVPDLGAYFSTNMFRYDTQTTLSRCLKELSLLRFVQLCFQVKGRWGHREDTGCGQAVSCLFLTVPWVFWLMWKTCARSGSHWAPLTPFLSLPWHYFLQKWTVPSHQSLCTNRWSTTNCRRHFPTSIKSAHVQYSESTKKKRTQEEGHKSAEKLKRRNAAITNIIWPHWMVCTRATSRKGHRGAFLHLEIFSSSLAQRKVKISPPKNNGHNILMSPYANKSQCSNISVAVRGLKAETDTSTHPCTCL